MLRGEGSLQACAGIIWRASLSRIEVCSIKSIHFRNFGPGKLVSEAHPDDLAISTLHLSKVSTSMSAAGFPQQDGKRYLVLESLAKWRMSPKRWNDSNPSRSFREALSLEQSILWLSLTCFRCEGLFSRPLQHIDRVSPYSTPFSWVDGTHGTVNTGGFRGECAEDGCCV